MGCSTEPPNQMQTVPYRHAMDLRKASAFTLVEVLVVITIISILLVAAVPIFSNTSNSARQSSREIIKAHLQQARSHAIASGNPTALAIPVSGADPALSNRALSLVEVELDTAGTYVPLKDANGQDLLLQRWEKLSGNFRFLSASQASTSRQTVLDSADTLEVSFKGKSYTCRMIVFSPGGQIVRPPSGTPVNFAIAQAVNQGGSVVITDKTGGKPVFDLLQVNRLTGRTRFIEP